MRRILCLALAAAMTVGVGAASAQPYQPGPPSHGPGYRPPGPPGGPGYGRPPGGRPPGSYRRPPPWGATPAHWRRWNRGDRFYGPRYAIPNWRLYSLPAPLGGYNWVRAGGEFVMIDPNGHVGGVFVSPAYP